MSSVNSNIKYRPDIDGLRALAILPVVIYHAFPRYAPGGFVGVDIFFVISGFLISLIIFKGLINNNLSFTDFYTHRVKRIFPALILVVSTCYVIGWFSLLPDEFKQLGKHIAAGMGFVQNFVLWKEAGYFDVATELKPLMHLWSLAVEEQFYLIFPLFLWILWKSRINVLTSLFILCLISFILNLKGINKDPIKTFFLPQTRFWELMIGSIIAYFYAFNTWRPSFSKYLNLSIFNNIFFREVPEEKDRKLILSSILSFVGLLLILYAVASYNHTTPYPGKKAVVPVLGAALLIIAGPTAWVNRYLLSNKVVIWVGLISYPLYLWHWPLLSFAQIVESETPSREIRITAVVVSFILATLTYYLVEKRVRYGRSTWTKITLLSVLAVVIGYIGYNAYIRNGLLFRGVAKGNDVFSYIHHWNGWETCDIVPNTGSGGCRILDEKKPIDVLVIGDSHAGHLASGLRSELTGKNINVSIMLFAGCFPSYSVKKEGVSYFDCPDNTINTAIDYAIKTKSIHTVILSGYAALQIQVNRFHETSTLPQEQINKNINVLMAGMDETFSALLASGKRIIYVVDNPELLSDPKSCVQRFGYYNKCEIKLDKKLYLDRNFLYHNMLGELREKYPTVLFTETADFFCDENYCYGHGAGGLWYATRDHLSPVGSREFVKSFSRLLY